MPSSPTIGAARPSFAQASARTPPPARGPVLELGIGGFSYPDLHDPGRLAALYGIFLSELRAADSVLAARYTAWKAAPADLDPKAVSEVIVEVAPYVSRFVARLFGIQAEREALRARVHAHDPVFRFKIDFVRRRALAHIKSAADLDPERRRDAEALMEALRADPSWPFDPPGAEAGGAISVSVTRLSTTGTSISPTVDALWSAALPAGSVAAEARVPQRDPESELARFTCLLMDAEAVLTASAKSGAPSLPETLTVRVRAARLAIGDAD